LFIFDPASNNFKYLRTNTVYTNSPTSVAALLADPGTQAATPITGGPNTYDATFPMPNTTDSKLYLIWDYRKSTPVELCYSDISEEEACCDCGGTVPSQNRVADLCIESGASAPAGVPIQVVVPPQSGVTAGTFITTTTQPTCVYVVGAETINSPTAAINSVLVTVTDCDQVCTTYTFTGDVGGGTYDYIDCSGQNVTAELTQGQSITVCARSFTNTNIIAQAQCSCVLSWEVERCQIEDTGTPPVFYIPQDGIIQVGDIVTLAGEGACTFEVIQSSNNAADSTVNTTVIECECNEYFIENPSGTETRTFFYTDCNDVVQTVQLNPTAVAIRCIKSFTQPQQFNVTFYNCGCTG